MPEELQTIIINAAIIIIGTLVSYGLFLFQQYMKQKMGADAYDKAQKAIKIAQDIAMIVVGYLKQIGEQQRLDGSELKAMAMVKVPQLIKEMAGIDITPEQADQLIEWAYTYISALDKPAEE